MKGLLAIFYSSYVEARPVRPCTQSLAVLLELIIAPMTLLYVPRWPGKLAISDHSRDPFHSNPTNFSRILGRTTIQDFFLRIDLLSIPCGMLYCTGHIALLVRRLIHIFSMVRLLLDHHTCLRCLSVRPSECSLGTDSEVPQTHRRLAEM